MLKEEMQATRDSASVWIETDLLFTWECDDPNHPVTMDMQITCTRCLMCIAGPDKGTFRRGRKVYGGRTDNLPTMGASDVISEKSLHDLSLGNGHGIIRADGVRRCYNCQHRNERAEGEKK